MSTGDLICLGVAGFVAFLIFGLLIVVAMISGQKSGWRTSEPYDDGTPEGAKAEESEWWA